MDSLEVGLAKEEPIILEYIKAGKPKRRWYNPMNYNGAMAGLGYGLTWPAIVLAYLSGFNNLYDKFLPHESLQDNFVYYAFRVPSEFVGSYIGSLVDDSTKYDNLVGFVGYLMVWALAGHITEKTISFVKGKISVRK